MTERLARSEQRLAEIDAALVEGDLARSRLDEALGGGRGRLAELETEQEAAREQRVHWQVQEAHVAGGLRSADERLQRAVRPCATRPSARCTRSRGELAQLDADTAALSAQQSEWREQRAERAGGAATSSRRPARDAETALALAEAALADAERDVAASPRRARRRERGEPHACRCGSPRPPGRGAASSSGSRPSGTGRSSS